MTNHRFDEPQTGGGSVPLPPPAVRLTNLHVAWDTSLILHGITTDVPQGQTVAITGANGSGKSTLMRAMMGSAPITAGDVEIFGSSITDHRNMPWHRIGYVPQRLNSGGAISATVEEVVRSGLRGRGRLFARPGDGARARAALERVGLAHRAKDPLAILSGGQQQRALIARALVREPDLLIMDEPMAGIDAHSRQRLAKIISQARIGGTTIILVLHELGELAGLLDRELHIQHGHIVYDGSANNPDEHAHDHHSGDHHPDANHAQRRREHLYSAATMNSFLAGDES